MPTLVESCAKGINASGVPWSALIRVSAMWCVLVDRVLVAIFMAILSNCPLIRKKDKRAIHIQCHYWHWLYARMLGLTGAEFSRRLFCTPLVTATLHRRFAGRSRVLLISNWSHKDCPVSRRVQIAMRIVLSIDTHAWIIQQFKRVRQYPFGYITTKA